MATAMNASNHHLKIIDAIDALVAYDRGATDSGIHDEELIRQVIDYLESIDDFEFRTICAEYSKRFLTDEALAQGYGMANILAFGKWLKDNGIDP